MKSQTAKSARTPRAAIPPIIGKRLQKKLPATVPCPIDDPLAYAMMVEGDCMAPEIADGDIIICSPAMNVVAGVIVAFSFGDGRKGSVKRLTYLPPPMRPGDEIERLIRLEMSNPQKTLFLQRSAVEKMHAVAGVVRNGKYIALEARRAS